MFNAYSYKKNMPSALQMSHTIYKMLSYRRETALRLG